MTVSLPDSGPLVDENGMPTKTGQKFVVDVTDSINTIQARGPTARRPATLVSPGDPYFDTTLGKPIWLKSVRPNVWIDASGATV